MSINPIEIKGNWDKGFVLDKHVISSVPIGENAYGYMQYDTVRSELGELVFQLKYRGRFENVDKIVNLIKPFLDSFSELREADIVLPVPPSKIRNFQPVNELAREIAEYLSISYTDEVLEKVSTAQSKDMDKSTKTVKGSIIAKMRAKREHNILLIDDLFQSGETLSECVNVLRNDPMLKRVYALVMTKTR